MIAHQGFTLLFVSGLYACQPKAAIFCWRLAGFEKMSDESFCQKTVEEAQKDFLTESAGVRRLMSILWCILLGC